MVRITRNVHARVSQSHPCTSQHDSAIRIEQSPRGSPSVNRVNVANDHIKGAEALSTLIAWSREADFSIVQLNAPHSRVLDGRAAKNLCPARRHLRRMPGL